MLLSFGEGRIDPTIRFQTEEIDGMRVMLGRDLARVMYQTDSTAGVQQLLRRWGFELQRLASVKHDVKQSLRAQFGLKLRDGYSTFANGYHFLIMAMNSRTTQADRVKSYMLGRVAEAQANEVSERSTGMSLRQHIVQDLTHALPEERAEAAFNAMMRIGASMGVPVHIAQQEAAKRVEKSTGVCLLGMVAASSANDDIKEDTEMLEPGDLARELGIESAMKMNQLIAQIGFQVKRINGNWEPTPAGRAHACKHAWTNKSKEGYNWKWRVTAVRVRLAANGLLPVRHDAQMPEKGAGPNVRGTTVTLPS
jgi:hypothetical protein